MDDHFTEAHLVLRRFTGVPLPATGWRIRVRLADTAAQNVLVDLPTGFGRERGNWWYVNALRHTAGGPAAGTVSVAAEVTLDDGIDYLLGDPLWHDATPSAAPGLYVLTGFDHHAPGVVRVYLDHEGRTIGIDLPLSDDGKEIRARPRAGSVLVLQAPGSEGTSGCRHDVEVPKSAAYVTGCHNRLPSCAPDHRTTGADSFSPPLELPCSRPGVRDVDRTARTRHQRPGLGSCGP